MDMLQVIDGMLKNIQLKKYLTTVNQGPIIYLKYRISINLNSISIFK